RFSCAVKRAALWERVYKGGRLRTDGERLVDVLMAAGDLGTLLRRYLDAGAAWKRALAVAKEINSPRLNAIKKRMPAFAARVQSEREAGALADTLSTSPRDAKARRRMLRVQLVELDRPLEAVKYIDAAEDEATKTNTRLAIESLDRLSEEATLQLAEWYGELANQAGPGGKELMVARSRVCYKQFFKRHKDRTDALAMRASLGMQKLEGKGLDNANVTANLKPGEEITDLKLAEFVAAHPNLTRLTRREIGTFRKITDLRPLERLKKLTTLELYQGGKIKDLTPLTRLPNLTSLTLRGLESDNISVLSGLSKLTSLDIKESPTITDIAPVGRLRRLRSLNLSGCVKVSDLTPISQLAELTHLDLSGCKSVTYVAPLSKVAGTIVSLNLNGTKVDRVYYYLGRMKKLKRLDLRRCDEISPRDVRKLTKRLSKCKVLSDTPK
ncbi:MAG: leucine-rich repeat domain-containing protein, partial [bacterium]|nr:leucine-rich repeat domain-containing protein [bacterium]